MAAWIRILAGLFVVTCLGCHSNSEAPERDADASRDDSATDAGAFDDGPGRARDENSVDSEVEGAADAQQSADGPLATADADAPPDGSTAPILPCGTMQATGNVLIDTGHGTSIGRLRQSGDRLLSGDDAHHWVLWDVAHRAQLAAGDSPVVNLAGSIVLVGGVGSFNLLSAENGQPRTTISSAAPVVGLAFDGSYAWAASASKLMAWSTSGQVLVDKSGDYSSAQLFAALNELRVALGPAGANVVERIQVSDGSSMISPSFLGSFHSWFTDGDRFLTTAGTAVRVYSSAAALQQVVSISVLTGLTGQGDYFWVGQDSAPYSLTIYAVGRDAPAATYPGIPGGVASSRSLAVIEPGSLDIIDLSGPEVVMTHHDAPVASRSTFAADAAGHWSIGDSHGVIYDSTHFGDSGGPVPLSCGQVWSMAGAASGRVAIAMAAGQILYFDLQPGSRRLEGALPFSSSRIEISSDGLVLGAQGELFDSQYHKDRSLKVFGLPAGTNTRTWPYSYDTAPFLFFDFTLSRGAARIGQLTCMSNVCTRAISSIADGSLDYSDMLPNAERLMLSLAPTGTLAAVSDGPPGSSPAPATKIYDNGTLVGAVSGFVVGWIDDSRLLVQTFEDGRDVYVGSAICDAHGNVLGSPNLPQLVRWGFPEETSRVRMIGTTSIYSALHNAIYSLSDGSLLWKSSDSAGGVGAVAGTHVVFTAGEVGNLDTGHRVFAEDH